MKFEGGGNLQQGPKEPVPNALHELEEVANELQMRLALLAHGEKHPEISFNLENPRDNPSEIRTVAMNEWIKDDASNFGDYLDSNRHKLIDPKDAQSLRELLAHLREGSDTLH